MDTAKCFVVMPFGKKPVPGTDRSFDFDKIFRVIMQPAIRAAGFEPVRADESASSGLIHNEMFEDLRDRPVVLVDLSLHNPNVFYELGVRHVMAQRGTVLMCESATHLPFDVKLSRVIHYDYDGVAFDWEEAERVKPLITNSLRDAATRPDSPVHAMLDRVLQDRIGTLGSGVDAYEQQAESSGSLKQYAQTVARSWKNDEALERLVDRHGGSRFGALALAEFCLSPDSPPDGAERAASRLRVYGEYELAAELFAGLDAENRLDAWRYIQYGSAVSEMDMTPTGGERGLTIQRKGLELAEKEFRDHESDEARWNYAYCLNSVGGMYEWIWRIGERLDEGKLKAAISNFSSSAEAVGAPPLWLNFVLRNHLKLLYLLRARDGRRDRPDTERHIPAILRIKADRAAGADVQSSVGWYRVIARVEQGSEDTSVRAAVRQLDEDARLHAADPMFNRAQLYYFTRRMMSDSTDYQMHPELWGPIAQLLKDAAYRSLQA